MTRIDEKDTFLLPPSFTPKDFIAVSSAAIGEAAAVQRRHLKKPSG
jgi:hypothetical protein